VKRAGSVVGELLKRGSFRRNIGLGAIWMSWDKIAGPDFAQQTRPIKVVGRVLYVGVEGASLHHKMSFIKETMLSRIRAFTGGRYISDIVFQARPKSATPCRPGPS